MTRLVVSEFHLDSVCILKCSPCDIVLLTVRCVVAALYTSQISFTLQELTYSNYVEKFKHLLYLEEIQQGLDIQNYNMYKVNRISSFELTIILKSYKDFSCENFWFVPFRVSVMLYEDKFKFK